MKKLILTLTLIICCRAGAQGFLDEISGDITSSDLVTEKIQKMSPTKRIFIISNENNSFNKGDFISLVFLDKITARGIVAKIKNNFAGIKIVKINSWSHWQKLIPGANVQIITGDDSKFRSANDKKESEESDEASLIQNDGDLYNDVVIEDEVLEVGENKNRHLKQDNMLTINYGQVRSLDQNSANVGYQQFILSYGYQIRDNLWVEASYGQNIIRDFPSTGIDTTLRQVSGKLKYTFKVPFYSYIQPYIGFLSAAGNSPQAGIDPTGNTSQTDLDNETKLVDSLTKNEVIFGATVVRHLAPGWYARVDIGSDAVSGGFGLEF
tara:strand:+ start:3956 stop:4924 length:969 start_codon:yes stop_codon:yes gene_type:complete